MAFYWEYQLRQRIRRHRITEVMLCLFFLSIAIGFAVAYEESRVVDEIDFGFYTHQSVTYNYDLGFGVLAGGMGLLFCGTFLLVDLLCCKVASIQVGSDHLVFYRGFSRPTLYVNGTARRAQMAHYLEAPLSDGSKVTISMGKRSSHISFSNGHPAVDL